MKLIEPVWIKILKIMVKQNEGMRVSDVVKKYQIKEKNQKVYSSIHLNLKLMKKDGYVTYDDKMMRYYLTEKGEAIGLAHSLKGCINE